MYGDRFTLGAAHALERLFATDPALAGPVPASGGHSQGVPDREALGGHSGPASSLRDGSVADLSP